MKKNQFNMKRIIPAACSAVFVVCLTGCDIDNGYRAERALWQAEKNVARILKESDGALTEGNYKNIIAQYRRAAETAPLEPVAAKTQFIIANIYFTQGKYEKAVDELKAVIRNFSSTGAVASRAQFAIGRIFERTRKWAEAREEYEKVTDLYPLTNLGLSVPLYIVKHYKDTAQREETDKAYQVWRRHFESLASQFEETPVAPLVLQALARLHLLTGNTKAAIEAWDAVIEQYPDTAEAARSLLVKASVLADTLNDLPSAIKAYGAFIERYPKHSLVPQIKFRQGVLYLRSNTPQEGEKIFSVLLKQYPDDEKISVNALVGLSYYYRTMKDTVQLLATYKELEKRYPASKAAISVPYLIAAYYKQTGQVDKAKEALNAAVAAYEEKLKNAQKKGSLRDIVHPLALCYLERGQPQEAVALLKNTADRYSEDPLYLLDLASLYKNLEASDEAAGVYKELLERYPDNERISRLIRTQIDALEERVAE